MSPPKKKRRTSGSRGFISKEPTAANTVAIDNHCPNCQMPFAALSVVQTPSWHLFECLETDRNGQLECSKGSDCDSTIASHFFKWTHCRLAAYRSGVALDTEPVIEYVTSGNVPHVDFKNNIIPKIIGDGVDIKSSQLSQNTIITNNCFTKQSKITSFFTQTNKPHIKQTTLVSTSTKIITARKSYPDLDHWKHTGNQSKSSESIQNIKNEIDVKPNNRTKYSCPKYKKLVDVPFVVDAFKYGEIPGITAYFLSHFHYDHYGGLTNKFRKHLYCSQITANLVKLKFSGIPDTCIHSLPLNERRFVTGVEVILIEANHCPGAVMFLFRYTDGRIILHTGDFRADVDMEQHPALLLPLNVDFLYLDTTYCQPCYDFPTQSEVIDFVVKAAKKQVREVAGTLIVCGSYTIGKEKVFTAIAEALNLKVWAARAKRKIFECLEDDCLNLLLTEDIDKAGVHVVAMGELNFQFLEEYLSKTTRRFNNILAFRPTGWEHQRRGSKNSSKLISAVPKKHGRVTICGVPYSEHSNFNELRRFVQFVKPVNVIPTVNVTGDKARQQMDIIRSWMRKTPFDSVKI